MSALRERARQVALDAFGMPGLSDDTKLHGLTFGTVVEVAKTAAARECAVLLVRNAELLAALKAVVSIADRKTVEFDQARAAIARATS